MMGGVESWGERRNQEQLMAQKKFFPRILFSSDSEETAQAVKQGLCDCLELLFIEEFSPLVK